MPAERIAMRHVRDVLRLKAAGVSGNEIARRVGVAPSTVRLTLKRLAAAGLSWPLPAELTDAALETQLFTAVGKKQGHRRLGEPGWAAVHPELKRKHITLQILWDEYIERQPEGYRYSRILRAVPRLGSAAVGNDAAKSCRRRQAVCRLRRRHGTGHCRSADRQDPAGADLCRRARRFQLHLRRGELDPGAGRLDRRLHPGVRGDRRRAQPAGAGQCQGRGDQGPKLDLLNGHTRVR
jgi:DNA-binding IclR family transcriptional regulator